MKKIRNKKGIAIIMCLTVCFVFLALGTFIMINSYSQMGIARKYRFEGEALNIAEAGVSWKLFEMEKKGTFPKITNGADGEQIFGKGKFKVKIYNNALSDLTYYWADGKLNIPPHCIGIQSEGIVKEGAWEVSKIVKVVAGYPRCPSTIWSDGVIRMNVASNDPAGTEPLTDDIWMPGEPSTGELNAFTAVVDSVDGWIGNIHSNNESDSPAYRCTLDPGNNVNLNIKGGKVSATGDMGAEAVFKVNGSGGKAVENAPKKTIFAASYNELYEKEKKKNGTFINFDQNKNDIGWLAALFASDITFLGKLRKSGSNVEAYMKYKVPAPTLTNPLRKKTKYKWVDVAPNLPDGISWNSSTSTLVIEEGRNYQWGGNLDMQDINLEIQGSHGSSFFVDGNITANNIKLTAESFRFASKDKDITLKNLQFNIVGTEESDGVALYTKNLTVTTDADEIPPGGNQFRGILYSNGGTIDLTNQYVGADNNLKLEGLIVNPSKTANIPRLLVKNKGGDDYKVEIKYNPYVADSIINFEKIQVKLEPYYWEIE